MLCLLHIENIAVIEEADIQFRPGFNALTGETGAGKSIVIDAMGAVLGGRTSRDLIRTGAAKAFVSAEFDSVPNDLPSLEANGIATDEGTLMLQRELYADGKNVCRVNGRPVTVSQLRQIGVELLNIHGQHENQALLQPERHVEYLDEEQHGAYLDRFGRTDPQLWVYQEKYRRMQSVAEKIRSLRMDEAERARRVDSLRFQIGELEKADLQPGEDEELAERRNLLRNGEKYLSALREADACLNGGDDYGGAASALQDAKNAIYGIRGLSSELEELFQRLDDAYCEVYDLATIARDKRGEFDFSPEELDAVAAGAGFSETLTGTLTGEYEVRLFFLEALGRLENMFHR